MSGINLLTCVLTALSGVVRNDCQGESALNAVRHRETVRDSEEKRKEEIRRYIERVQMTAGFTGNEIAKQCCTILYPDVLTLTRESRNGLHTVVSNRRFTHFNSEVPLHPPFQSDR
jgi:hypothetical protein